MYKPIYEPRGRAKEYCGLACNIYTGCPHRCIYCYAPMALRKSREEFQSNVRPRKDIVKSVKTQLARENIIGKTIQLCFTCDPYPMGYDSTPTREIIKAIKKSGNHVQILTKNGLDCKRDFDLLDSHDSFGVTISGGADQIRANEPHASRLTERLNALDAAHRLGVKTWASFEPVYSESTVYIAIEWLEYIDLYKIGKLNHFPSEINWAKFGSECERLCKKFDRDYYIKDDLRREMEKEEKAC